MITRRHFLGLGFAGLSGLPACTGLNLTPSRTGDGTRPWSGRQLDAAGEIAKRNGGKGWAAWEGWHEAAGWQTGERAPILSITKSLAGLAAVKASQEGWLSATEPVADTIHEWKGDSRKRRITILMLLQQTAGLDAGGSALYHGVISDKGSVAISRQAVDEPGTQFRYGPVCWEVLAELMQRKLSSRGETLESFLHRAVMRPIGLSSPNWRADRKKRFYLSTGAELNVAELGRLGKTLGKLLRGENASGFEAGHFNQLSRVSAANRMFGAGIWRNTHAASGQAVEIEDVLDPPRGAGFWQSACLSKRQPANLVGLIGSSGRRVFIWPDSGRVVARLGTSSAWRDQPFLSALA